MGATAAAPQPRPVAKATPAAPARAKATPRPAANDRGQASATPGAYAQAVATGKPGGKPHGNQAPGKAAKPANQGGASLLLDMIAGGIAGGVQLVRGALGANGPGHGAHRKAEAEPAELVAPIPEPISEAHRLARSAMALPTNVVPFNAPRALDLHSEKPPGKDDSRNADIARHRSVFAEAASAAARLHGELASDAARLASEAADAAGRRADRAQALLDTELGGIADGLRSARGTLDTRTDNAIALVEARARLARRAVHAAAASALGTLSAKAKQVGDQLKLSKDRLAEITTSAGTRKTELDASGKAAVAALKLLAKTPQIGFPYIGAAIPDANNELTLTGVPKILGPRIDALTEENSAQDELLEKSITNIGKAGKLAFADFEEMLRRAEKAGPDAVNAARRSAIGQVNAGAKQMGAALRQANTAAATALVKQHDAARAQAIGSAEARQRSEAQAAISRARHDIQATAALAASQPGGIRALATGFVPETRRPPAEFAGVVIRASSAFAGRLRGLGSEQRPRLARTAAGGSEELDRQSEATGLRQDDAAAQGAAQLEATARAAGASLEEQADKGSAGFIKLAAPVGQAMQGFLPPLAAEYKAKLDAMHAGVEAADAEFTTTYQGMIGPPAPPPPGKVDGDTTPVKTKMHPEQFKTLADKIAPKPAEDESVKDVPDKSRGVVGKDLQTRSQGLRGAMGAFQRTDVDTIMRNLRGLTQRRGTGLRAYYNDNMLFGSLDGDLRAGLNRMLSDPITNTYNINAAIKHLNGDEAGAALDEMKAAVHLWNDNARVAEVQHSLSPATAVELMRDHGGDMAKIGADLEGPARDTFNLLKDVNEGNKAAQTNAANAIDLKVAIDAAHKKQADKGNDTTFAIAASIILPGIGPGIVAAKRGVEGMGKQEADEGGDAVRKAIKDAHDRAGNDRISGADPELLAIGAIDPKEDKKRRDAAWDGTVKAFADRNPIPKGQKPATGWDGKPYDGPGAALYDYASRPRDYNQVRYDPLTGFQGRSFTIKLADDQKLWVEQALKHGVESDEAAAATGLIIKGRAGTKGDFDQLDDAFHDKKGDAVEGENPSAEEIKRRKEDGDKRMQRIHELEAGFENQRDGGHRKADDVKKEFETWADKTAGSNTAKAKYIKGISTKADGDPAAAWFYAVEGAGTDTDLLKKTSGRMSRKQIEAASDKYNADNPDGPTIKQRLGIQSQHDLRWKTIFNGDFFPEVTGDDANDLKLKFLGKPATPLEAGEVARLNAKQQIDQAGWAGKLLAYGDYRRLVNGSEELRQQMGLTKAQYADSFNPDGSINMVNPATGKVGPIGNFQPDGSFVPRFGGNQTDFELACNMATLTAGSYKEATDRIANYVSTIIVVTAAIVSTVLTAGAAASIWIPVLVTAGAGLLAIGTNIAIKGGRYGAEEMGKDLAMTVIQAATAGLGAAAGAALKGGLPALKLAAGSISGIAKMEPAALAAATRTAAMANALVKSGQIAEQEAAQLAARVAVQRGLTVGEEIAVGTLSGGFAGGANSLVDGEAWREGNLGKNFLHGVARGSFGGAAGSGAAALGSNAVKALAGTKSGAAALTRMFGEAGAENVTGGLMRVAGSTSAGFSQSLVEGAYSSAVQGREMSASELASEAGWAALQNAAQSVGEHTAERAATPHGPAGSPHSTTAAPHDEAPLRAANDNEAPRTGHDSNAPRAANDNDRPTRSASSEPEAPGRPGGHAAPEEPAPRKPRARTPGPEDEEVTGVHSRPAGHGSDEEVTGVHPRPAGGEQPPEYILDHWDPGTVIKSTIDPHSETMAVANYHELILAQGQHEAGLYYNPATGEYVVIQGDPRTVPHDLLDGRPEDWLLRAHYHPQEGNEPTVAQWRQVPSGRNGDLSVVEYEARMLGRKVTARIHYYVDGQLTYTDYSFDPHAAKPYSIERPDPRGGPPRSVSYADLDSYGRAFEKKFGWSPHIPDEPAPILGAGHAPAAAVPPPAGPGQPRAIPDSFEFHHGTTIEGKAAIEAQGIIANRGKISADDFGAAFYVAFERAAAQTYASTRSGAEHDPSAGAVLSFRLSREEMGVIVDVRPGGKDRAAWDNFMTEPTVKGKMLELAEKHGWPTTREQELNAMGGVERRAVLFEEFLARQGLKDADAILGDLGGERTGGIGQGHQIAIRSQRLADLLTEQLPGRAAPRGTADAAAATPLPEKPQAGVPRRPKAATEDAVAPRAIEPATHEPATASDTMTSAPTGSKAAPPTSEDSGGPVAPGERDRQQGRSKLDPAAALAARSSREAIDARVRDLRNEGAIAGWTTQDAAQGREILRAQRPPKPSEAEPILRRLLQTTNPEERLGELQHLLATQKHDEKVRAFLEWQEKAWRFQVGNEIAARRAATAPIQAEQTRQTNLREAERVERDANKGIKALMRKNGPNYGDALDATADRIFGEPRWSQMQEARAAAGLPPLKLNPDHLIPLDEIANMGELKPLLEMHQGADDRIKGEIRRALEGLGDVRDNLWPMESRANQHMKGARSWHHVSFEEAADFGYTPDDVRSMRREEDRMRREIKARIEQLVRHFESQLAGAPAGPPPPPRALPPLPPLPDV